VHAKKIAKLADATAWALEFWAVPKILSFGFAVLGTTCVLDATSHGSVYLESRGQGLIPPSFLRSRRRGFANSLLPTGARPSRRWCSYV